MIEFSQLEIVNKVEDKQYLFMNKRYIIGAEPANQKGLLSGVNVFTIYDKSVMRVVVKVVTKQKFEHFLDWILKVKDKTEIRIRKNECKISYKFINQDGTATCASQLRIR